MGDVSSGMASTVIQLYLKEILGAFLHPGTGVRCSAMRVVQLVLAQGLVHPVQVRFTSKHRTCRYGDIDPTCGAAARPLLRG